VSGSLASNAVTENQAEAKLAIILRQLFSSRKKPATRWRRYTLTALAATLPVWLVAGAYSLLWPETYTSQMTLILPAANSQSNVALDDIGQTSTSAGSPFALRTMSPNVIYKTIAQSSRVRGLAAKQLGLDYEDLKKPYIKLIEETSMMVFHVAGPDGSEAQRRAAAYLAALDQQLNELRQDEVERRAKAIEKSIEPVRANLDKSRRTLEEFHQQNGLVSLEQFKSLTAGLEDLRRKYTARQAEYESVTAERLRIGAVLGISIENAVDALRLQSDSRFMALLKEHGEATAEYTSRRRQWGNRHPNVLMASARLNAATGALEQLAKDVRVGRDAVQLASLHLGDSRDRSELYRKFVELDARAQGLRTAIASMDQSTQELQSQIERQSRRAAQLEDLERDHKIAEAVFSSALARLDTGRQDIYASYPLVQLMSPPSLPTSPSSPRLLYAVAGASVCSIFIAIALVLAWARTRFARVI
jgi:uncharacterized protein involved in exopolysaccharide biosynthesis